MKWVHHPAGEARAAWSPPADARALTVLVAGGPFRLDVEEEVVELRQLGDYVLFGPGIAHAGRLWARRRCSPCGGPSATAHLQVFEP
ncbi:hypothetical protein [Amycolatopsis sp. NPDC001319]|uniref:hypothetical protein n=1 Tax=unclassified Amycolatopsis TaxID=2618356 RepID=UPI0036B82F62